MQPHNDGVDLESLSCPQDLFTRRSELDYEFRFHCQLSVPRHQFLKPPQARNATILSHLSEAAASVPTKTIGLPDWRDDMEQNEFCSEVVGERDGIWQGMQRSFTEVRSEQKGPN